MIPGSQASAKRVPPTSFWKVPAARQAMMLGCLRPRVSATSQGVPSGVRLMLLCLSDGMTCMSRNKCLGVHFNNTDWCGEQHGLVHSSVVQSDGFQQATSASRETCLVLGEHLQRWQAWQSNCSGLACLGDSLMDGQRTGATLQQALQDAALSSCY